MSVFKCKMCGGDLVVEEGKSVCECECCGSKQTLPKFDDEKKTVLFTRANELRSKCEFDKAAEVYEKIVSEFPEEAEAYWGLILCRYGIEYVDDPQSSRKIPTCHRSSYDIVLDEPDFEMVMEYSDTFSKAVYREQAKEIERLRSKIMEVSSKEKPYDIFICYKEKDENGERTVDSVIAQNVYDALTAKGYRVFFSRISLEDKLGREYEPYIFAALHSAKIMLVFGTKYDYINSVWVKNEWSRFLALIKGGAEKFIIPCYKDIDAYDIPKEIRSFQAQDMGKVGAVQDLVRGIEKIMGKKNDEATQTITQVVEQSSVKPENIELSTLVTRTQLFVEAGDWKRAEEYCEKILDKDPKNGEVYLLKEMAEKQCSDLKKLLQFYCDKGLTSCSKNLEFAKRFGGSDIIEKLAEFDEKLKSATNEEQMEKFMFDPNNYVDKGDYIELIHPIGNIKMIQKNLIFKDGWFFVYENFDWDTAMKLAKELNIGDFNDWRIPTIEELKTIYKIKDVCKIMQNRYRDYSYCWSSTTLQNLSDYAWDVYLRTGRVYSHSKSVRNNVLCVR